MFQLSIVRYVPIILLLLVTADRRRPCRSARVLTFPVIALVLAFGALYHLQHLPVR